VNPAIREFNITTHFITTVAKPAENSAKKSKMVQEKIAVVRPAFSDKWQKQQTFF
jgi:hypothetical protein